MTQPERDGRDGGIFACPYCKQQTDVPGAADFWMVDAASAACEHCGKEFVIVESFPMTEEQYMAASPNARPLRATSGKAFPLRSDSPS